jgi:O-antigen/teichoic acid export membrane protein
LILGYYHGSEAVASLRVILPAANFNNLVMSSFTLLYMPLATRLFSKEDLNGINNLYWHTAIWLGVLSFPLFAITFSMAKPLTLALYGARYADSFVYLQLLSLGLYFNVVLGFNGLTLKVLGRLRYIVTINLTAVLANIILDLLLIPKMGAMGAALGTAGALIIHNLLKQAGLRLASGMTFFEGRYWSHYFLIAVSAGGLLLISNYLITSVYINGILVMVVSLLVIYLSRHRLNIEETFPELQKWSFIKRFLKKPAVAFHEIDLIHGK